MGEDSLWKRVFFFYIRMNGNQKFSACILSHKSKSLPVTSPWLSGADEEGVKTLTDKMLLTHFKVVPDYSGKLEANTMGISLCCKHSQSWLSQGNRILIVSSSHWLAAEVENYSKISSLRYITSWTLLSLDGSRTSRVSEAWSRFGHHPWYSGSLSLYLPTVEVLFLIVDLQHEPGGELCAEILLDW